MRYLSLMVVFAAALATFPAVADDVSEQHLTLKDHVFAPQELTVPAGQKIKLMITNEDSTNAEFESADLQREKVVAAHATVTVFIGPLQPGAYLFVDDFHRHTTTGTIIAH